MLIVLSVTSAGWIKPRRKKEDTEAARPKPQTSQRRNEVKIKFDVPGLLQSGTPIGRIAGAGAMRFGRQRLKAEQEQRLEGRGLRANGHDE